MKSCISLLVFLFAFCGSFAQSSSERAKQFIQHLGKEEFADALKLSSPAFQAKVNEESLAAIWKKVVTQYGPYQRNEATTDSANAGTVEVEAYFQNFKVPFSFSFDEKQLILGFFIRKQPERLNSLETKQSADGDTINIRVESGVISGTLLAPRGATGKVPLAIIIAGSGPTDRNGNNRYGVSADSYRLLAKDLAENGIASFRYDKRLVGASSHFNASEKDVVFSDFVEDAVTISNFFKAKPEFSKLVLIGHSEGSNIGMMAAQQVLPDQFISLCGPGEDLATVLETQLITQPELAEKAKPIIASLKNGIAVPRRNVPDELNSLFDPVSQPFVMSSFKVNPAEEIKKLTIPVMIIGGTKDLQVPIRHAEILKEANPGATLLLIRNMNHVLKQVRSTDKESNLATYNAPGLPLPDDLVIGIVNFIEGNQ